MNASVRALGYAVVAATDLDAWQRFGVELLGLQCARREDDRMLLRMDDHAYRLDIRRAEADDEAGVRVLGWDVGGEDALDELTKRLVDAGFPVTRLDGEAAAERQVEALVRFRDPDGNYDIELFWGLRSVAERFVSPTGASFVADELGLGHVAQVVRDEATYRRLYLDILGFRLSDRISRPADTFAGTFTHCNPRHHSFAFVPDPRRPAGVGHLMFQVSDLDTVGRAYDRALDGAAPVLSSLGMHTNDRMVSFYLRSPSGFGIEYGCGGILIDDATWLPTVHEAAHTWGHRRTSS